MLFETGGGCGMEGYPCDEQIWNGELLSAVMLIDETPFDPDGNCRVTVEPRNIDAEADFLRFGLDLYCVDQAGMDFDIQLGDLRDPDWDPSSGIGDRSIRLSRPDDRLRLQISAPRRSGSGRTSW